MSQVFDQMVVYMTSDSTAIDSWEEEWRGSFRDWFNDHYIGGTLSDDEVVRVIAMINNSISDDFVIGEWGGGFWRVRILPNAVWDKIEQHAKKTEQLSQHAIEQRDKNIKVEYEVCDDLHQQWLTMQTEAILTTLVDSGDRVYGTLCMGHTYTAVILSGTDEDGYDIVAEWFDYNDYSRQSKSFLIADVAELFINIDDRSMRIILSK